MEISFTGTSMYKVFKSGSKTTSHKYDAKRIQELMRVKIGDVLEAGSYGENHDYRGIIQLKNGSNIRVGDEFVNVEKQSRDAKNTVKEARWFTNARPGEPFYEKLNKVIKHLNGLISEFKAAHKK